MDVARALPTGVVTFLLTDIEGSTRLWESEPDAMRSALERHDGIVASCVRHQNGHVVKSKGEGDSVFAVFGRVRDAVAAALSIQSALGAEVWDTSTPIRVRMAIHTGQIELREGDYYGPTVIRCARLRTLAEGGQVLLSGVTAQLIQGQLPPDGSLKDLGTRPLKDLSAPERVWQLEHPQLQALATSTPQGKATTQVAPSRRAYKLTDHLNQSQDGRMWGPGVTHIATGPEDSHMAGWIRCYTSAWLAALLNAMDEGFRLPRLWEATVDRYPGSGDATVACREVTTTRQVPLPTVTAQHHARFAIFCAQAANAGGPHEREFNDWAAGWLAGQDSSGNSARSLADTLQSEAQRGVGMANPEALMLANAARSAMHAARVGWLFGRVREDETTRAVALAAESVHVARRMTEIDLPALAEQALLARPGAPVLPTRQAAPVASSRILRALPM
jgi:class 3 adenylate cyclase